MTTTFEMIAKAEGPLWQRNRNYAHVPTKDVEILVDQPRICRKCQQPIVYDPNVRYGGGWVHVSNGQATTDDCTWIDQPVVCSYCGTVDQSEVTFKQAAWSDDTDCARCGGYLGYPIGD